MSSLPCRPTSNLSSGSYSPEPLVPATWAPVEILDAHNSRLHHSTLPDQHMHALTDPRSDNGDSGAPPDTDRETDATKPRSRPQSLHSHHEPEVPDKQMSPTPTDSERESSVI